MATHLIGFTKEYEGVAGVESRYNGKLKGEDGYRRRKSNPNNLSIYSDEEENRQPIPGLNIVLSLDTTIQSIVEEELEAGLTYAEAEKGCAIVIEPHTGDILAMAARPHYNLNTREGVATGSNNYIFKTAIEPGSTIKALTIAAGMNEGLVTPRTLIDCENGYFRDGAVVVKDAYPKGQLTVTEILAKSNNVGTYKVGRQVGKEKFFEYLKQFGLGQPTPLNWVGEVRTKGTVGTSKQEFASATFGYAISATPMHMALAYATIANDGLAMKPHIVKQIVSNDGTVIESHDVTKLRQVLSPEVAKQLRKTMVAVTDEKNGTAKLARVPGFDVAGKTGTSRKYIHGEGYVEGRVICSFGGMMPAENPAFAIYVIVDEPQTTELNRYGGTLAAPIFSRIAQRTAHHLNLVPTNPEEEE